jgi:hypothetical protein
LQQGLFGVIVCAAMPLFLLVTAFFQPSGTKRALALFLTTYCLIASVTQVGFADDTTYLLELTLAASLLVPSAAGRPGGQVNPTARPLVPALGRPPEEETGRRCD